jgi:hypothetical protein
MRELLDDQLDEVGGGFGGGGNVAKTPATELPIKSGSAVPGANYGATPPLLAQPTSLPQPGKSAPFTNNEGYWNGQNWKFWNDGSFVGDGG